MTVGHHCLQTILLPARAEPPLLRRRHIPILDRRLTIAPQRPARLALVVRPDREIPTHKSVQIDHIVALAWAWRHGADRWSDAERLVFANDPANLVVTADEINSAKSDSGPAEWMPPAAASVCGYVIAWVSVVDAYDLGITGPDREAARSALTRC